jgi:hypothetical protein
MPKLLKAERRLRLALMALISSEFSVLIVDLLFVNVFRRQSNNACRPALDASALWLEGISENFSQCKTWNILEPSFIRIECFNGKLRRIKHISTVGAESVGIAVIEDP